MKKILTILISDIYPDIPHKNVPLSLQSKNMKLQALLKDSSFSVQVLILISLFVLGLVFSSILIGIYVFASGMTMQSAMNDAGAMRVIQMISSLVTFLLPSILAAGLFSEQPSRYLQLNKPSISVALLSVLTVLAFLPFLNLIISLNQKMVLPESMQMVEHWMREKENAATELTKMLMQTDNIGGLLLNVLLFGVVAGVGEEFLFRGVMQRLFEKIYKNPHAVIWIVAVIFSAIHVQFYGFIPRILLGALMGYLLLWTKSLWIAVLAHFVNNCFSVFAYYFSSDEATFEELDTIGTGDTLWMAGLSLILGMFFCYMIKQTAAKQNQSHLTH